MSFSDTILMRPRPSSVRELLLPRREKYHPSPSDWRDEVLYFLLPDRFSDGQENSRPLLDRNTCLLRAPQDFGLIVGRSPEATATRAEP